MSLPSEHVAPQAQNPASGPLEGQQPPSVQAANTFACGDYSMRHSSLKMTLFQDFLGLLMSLFARLLSFPGGIRLLSISQKQSCFLIQTLARSSSIWFWRFLLLALLKAGQSGLTPIVSLPISFCSVRAFVRRLCSGVF